MKKLVLLLTLACVSVVFARPNVYSNVVFGGSFGSGNSFSAQELGEDENGTMQYAAAGNYIFSGSGDNWGGWANSDSTMYPIIMENGATITFTAALISTNAASTDLNVKFERLPYNAEGNGAADTEPSYTSDSVTISGTGTNTYNITIPAQAGLTFSSFLLYDAATAAGLNPSTVYITNFILEGMEDNDSTPPSPSATTFATAPTTTGDSSITMTATTATDDNGVLYKFECTTDSAFSSDWQTSETYEATGLSSATEYTFTVQARDNSYAENFATVSAAASATTTGADTTPPSPSTTTATLDASAVTIEITAAASTDPSGVEYNFTSTLGPDSGWQDSNIFIATGLAQDTEYTYVVQARDGAGTPNLTVATTNVVTTGSETEGDLSEALTNLSGSSASGSALHDLALLGLELASSEAGRAVTFDSSGVAFDTALAGDNGRNVIRTIANDFDSYDFVYEISIVLDGANQNAFVGAGLGQLGTYGVPEWDTQNGGGFVSEIRFNESDIGTMINNNVSGTAWNPDKSSLTSLSNSVLRLQVSNDAAAETFTIKVDENYDGTFVSDFTEDTIAHSDIWDPSATPTQNTNYDVDEVVYFRGGQFDTNPNWAESSGGGNGTTYDQSLGYARIDSTDGAWAVMVVTDDNGEERVELADIGATAGDRITVTMDMIEFANSGGQTAGIKMESWDENGIISNSGDMKIDVADTWTTYTWNYTIATNATYLKVVPVQHNGISVGYDNVGVIPNPSSATEAPTVTRLFFGGDEGVTFKDLSITVSGGSVVVDPFSISSISSITGGSVITWAGQSGVTYDVEYKTSLVGGTWTTTVTGVAGSDGAVSATSDVDAASAFFRVIGQ